MKVFSAQVYSCFATGCAAFCLMNAGSLALAQAQENPVAQMTDSVPPSAGQMKVLDLPDAPQPQQSPSDGSQQPSSGGQQPAAGSSSSAQQPSATPPGQQAPGVEGKPITSQKSQHDLAEEQLKDQQKQRILGVVPNFNTSYVYGAASLTSGQKFKLALRSATDPVQFYFITPFVALIGQAEGSHYGYGGGIGGYAKRYGQTYADNFDGTMWGNAILPSILHQDPRYFRLGRGSVKRRILYALGTNVIARHDNTGRWEPNYSNVLGNLIAGGISNIYLPKDERGISSTITGGFTVTAEGGLGSMFQEFWPDIARHTIHKDPTNGLDAINRSKPNPNDDLPLFSNRNAPKKKKKNKANPDAPANPATPATQAAPTNQQP